MGERYQTFEAFWPYYLSEHRDRSCRMLHYVGTSTALLVVAYSLLTLQPWFLPLALVAGYGGAWVGHFLIEKNRPATFTYPLWSLRGDFRMLRLFVTGQLARDPGYQRVIFEGRDPHPPGGRPASG